MYRSFTDRVLGGVCGGLGTTLPVRPWTLRIAFGVLTILSGGLVAALYVGLWWTLPQESLVTGKRGGVLTTFLALILIGLMIVGWIGRSSGWFIAETGQDLLLPGVLLVLSGVFLLRQVVR